MYGGELSWWGVVRTRFIYLSIYRSIHRIHLFFYLYRPICLLINVSIYLSVNLSHMRNKSEKGEKRGCKGCCHDSSEVKWDRKCPAKPASLLAAKEWRRANFSVLGKYHFPSLPLLSYPHPLRHLVPPCLPQKIKGVRA